MEHALPRCLHGGYGGIGRGLLVCLQVLLVFRSEITIQRFLDSEGVSLSQMVKSLQRRGHARSRKELADFISRSADIQCNPCVHCDFLSM